MKKCLLVVIALYILMACPSWGSSTDKSRIDDYLDGYLSGITSNQEIIFAFAYPAELDEACYNRGTTMKKLSLNIKERYCKDVIESFKNTQKDSSAENEVCYVISCISKAPVGLRPDLIKLKEYINQLDILKAIACESARVAQFNKCLKEYQKWLKDAHSPQDLYLLINSQSDLKKVTEIVNNKEFASNVTNLDGKNIPTSEGVSWLWEQYYEIYPVTTKK